MYELPPASGEALNLQLQNASFGDPRLYLGLLQERETGNDHSNGLPSQHIFREGVHLSRVKDVSPFPSITLPESPE